MQREEHFLFLGARLVEERGVALLGAHAEVHEHGGVAAVVEDHVRRAAAVPVEQLGGVVPVVLQLSPFTANTGTPAAATAAAA